MASYAALKSTKQCHLTVKLLSDIAMFISGFLQLTSNAQLLVHFYNYSTSQQKLLRR